MNHLKYGLIAFLILFSPFLLSSEEDTPETPVKFNVSVIQHESKKYIALTYENFPHWHTYWKNPGDAGLPIKYHFFLNDSEIKLTELEWPSPSRFIEKGNMWAYGYEGQYTLYFNHPGREGKLKIKSNWLVCKHICIPGNIEISGELTKEKFKLISTNNNKVTELNTNQGSVKDRLANLPKVSKWPIELDIVMAKGTDDNTIQLFYSLDGSRLSQLNKSRNLLTPFPANLFDFKHEKIFSNKKEGIFAKMSVDWDGEYEEPAVELPKDGVFKKPYKLKFLFANPRNNRVEIIEKEFKQFSLDANERMSKFYSILSLQEPPKPIGYGDNKKVPSKKNNEKNEIPLLKAIIFALIGGFILNFMPCVLPVISIKLFGLIKNRDEGKSIILKHNIFYTLGVVFTFIILGLVVLGLKSAGESVGWGFQLQSPYFVAIMIIVLFIFTLNLFGLFEFQTPGGNFFGNLSVKEGVTGDFLSGVLATILSTPCSAPFLGTALTFAFSAGNLTIITVFIFIGIGLSTPFILTALFPSAIKVLPRPGKWMEDLKKFLGLTLILTTIWLIDVFQALTDGTLPLIKLNTVLALTFFGIYFYKKIGIRTWTRLLFLVFPLILLINLLNSPLTQSKSLSDSDLLIDKNTGKVSWLPWSTQKMEELKKENKLVFMDFTAKWCFTCKVNEKLVLDTEGFVNLVKEKNLTLLLGDWTKRDATIGNWLKTQGLVGVPAYFIQKPDGTLINLGETITLDKIKRNL